MTPTPTRTRPSRRAVRRTALLAAVLGLAGLVAVAGLPGTPPVQRAEAREAFSFRVATFNVLGDNHTRPYTHDDKYAPSRIRAEWMSDVLGSLGSPDIVGMQEVETSQLTSIRRATDGRYAAWPGNAVKGGVQASVMWRTDVWVATSRSTITIPFIKYQRAQPVVRLKNLATGRQIWVVNAHNAPRGYQSQRDTAVRIEIAKIKQLRATGLPVLFLGDLNEKKSVFCKVVGQTDLYSALGGKASGSSCSPPAGMRIDWIFGSADVRFDSFRMDSSMLKRWVNDHKVPVASISVP